MIKFRGQWPTSLAVLFSTMAAHNLLSIVNAEGQAHGRVTMLDSIPYYVGDVSVSQLLDVPASTLDSVTLSDIEVFPMTVISSNSSTYTGAEFTAVVDDYLARDDVFSLAFLKSELKRPECFVGVEN
jgi:hypothetical protein